MALAKLPPFLVGVPFVDLLTRPLAVLSLGVMEGFRGVLGVVLAPRGGAVGISPDSTFALSSFAPLRILRNWPSMES